MKYILYDEEQKLYFIDLGLMIFLKVQFPVEHPSAFVFNINEESLSDEISKIKTQFNSCFKPNKIFFDFERINFCTARVFKVLIDNFKEFELVFYNIKNNQRRIIETYYSDVYGLGSKQYLDALKVEKQIEEDCALQIAYSLGQTNIKSQDDADFNELILLKEKKWCDILQDCAISENQHIFRADMQKANKYFDLSLLDQDVFEFKLVIYYLILKLLSWIQKYKKVKWEQKNGKEILVDAEGEKKILLVSSSVTGAIVANAIGCYLNIPTIFIISLGPERQDDEKGKRLRKGINFDLIKNEKMIYIFDIIRFGREYGNLESILTSHNGRFFAALGIANYYFNISVHNQLGPTDIISLVDIRDSEEYLDYKIEGEISNDKL